MTAPSEETLCGPGWSASLLREDFEAGIGAVLAAMARRGADRAGPVGASNS
jgi:hypothetical protein